MSKNKPKVQYQAEGRKVVERASGKTVHRAPTHGAARAVARRMHGTVIWPGTTFGV